MARRISCLIIGILFAAGCSKADGVRIYGKVSYDGEPVALGTINLVPIDNTPGPSMGGAITDGKYDIAAQGGPRAGGVYRVEISASKKTGTMIAQPKSDEKVSEYVPILPPEFNTKSTLRHTIPQDAGKNEKDFLLQSPDKKSGQ